MKPSFSIVVAVALVVAPMLAQGGTRKKDARTHSDLNVTKKFDKATPQLAQTAATPKPTATPKTIKKAPISRGVLNSKALAKPQPAYPPVR
jgi:hypothetical protein